MLFKKLRFISLGVFLGIFRNNKSIYIVNKDALTPEIITSILSFFRIYWGNLFEFRLGRIYIFSQRYSPEGHNNIAVGNAHGYMNVMQTVATTNAFLGKDLHATELINAN